MAEEGLSPATGSSGTVIVSLKSIRRVERGKGCWALRAFTVDKDRLDR